MKNLTLIALGFILVNGCSSLPDLYIQRKANKLFIPYSSIIDIYDYGDSIAYFHDDLLKPSLGFCKIDTASPSTFISIFGSQGYYNIDRIKMGSSPKGLVFRDHEKFSFVNDGALSLFVEFDGVIYEIEQRMDYFLKWNQATHDGELTYYSVRLDGTKTIRFTGIIARDTKYFGVKNKRKLTEQNTLVDEFDIEIFRIDSETIFLKSSVICDTLHMIEKKDYQRAMRKGAFYR